MLCLVYCVVKIGSVFIQQLNDLPVMIELLPAYQKKKLFINATYS